MIRPMRGQVVVREIAEKAAGLWTPDANPRHAQTHRGEVLALGPPATTPRSFDGDAWVGGREIAHGFRVGDVVQYHFTHNHDAFTMPWTDGGEATWLPQQNVDGVWT